MNKDVDDALASSSHIVDAHSMDIQLENQQQLQDNCFTHMQQSMDSQQDSPPSAHGTQGPVAYNRFIYIYYFTYLRYFFNKYPHTLYTVKSTPTAYTNRVCKPNLCMNTNTHFTPIPTYFHKHYPKPSSPLRYPKIHLPSFDGSDPLGWLLLLRLQIYGDLTKFGLLFNPGGY